MKENVWKVNPEIEQFSIFANFFSIFYEEIGEKNPEMEKCEKKNDFGFSLFRVQVFHFPPIYKKIIPSPWGGGGGGYSVKYTPLAI